MNLYVVLFISLIASIYAELPAYIKPCDLSSNNLNACITANIKSTLLQFGEGIPELSIPPLKLLPMQYSFLEISNFYFGLWKYNVSGLESAKIQNVGGDFKNKVLIVEGLFPYVEASGLAKIKGNIFNLNFDSIGPIYANVTKITFRYILKIDHVENQGKIYMKKSSHELKINRTDGKFYVYLENLSFGNQEKTEMMNEVLNEKSDALLEMLFPILAKGLTTYLDSNVDKLFQAYSFIELFPQNDS